MGVGSDSVRAGARDAGTDVSHLVSKGEIGVMTKVTQVADMNIATCTETAVASSQISAIMKDCGSDGQPQVIAIDGGNQMEHLEKNTQEVECNLIVPGSDSDEECIE